MRAGHAIPKRRDRYPVAGLRWYKLPPQYSGNMKDRAVFVCVSIISSFPGCTPGDTAMSYGHFTRFIYKETRFLAMLWKGSEKRSGPESLRSSRLLKLSPEGHPP